MVEVENFLSLPLVVAVKISFYHYYRHSFSLLGGSYENPDLGFLLVLVVSCGVLVVVLVLCGGGVLEVVCLGR